MPQTRLASGFEKVENDPFILEILALAYRSDPKRSHQWLYSPEPNWRERIPAAVLRVGSVSEVREQVEA